MHSFTIPLTSDAYTRLHSDLIALNYLDPKTNREFWEKKIGRNRERDAFATRELESRGWKVVRIWGRALESFDPSRM